MNGHLHYFKVTFASADEMHAAAEAVQRAAAHNPMLLMADPPLVLWTDADIFAGLSLYTTKPGVTLLTETRQMQARPIDAGEIPIDALFIVGDDGHRRARASDSNS